MNTPRINHVMLVTVLLVAFFGVACKKKGPTLLNNSPGAGPPAGQDGAACTSDRRCDSDTCIQFGSGWRGGYCTTLDCIEEGCNGDDARCVEFLDGSSFCLDGCASNADCRSGYRCRPLDASGEKVCYRDDGDGPPAGSIGSDCDGDDDCIGDLSCDTDARGGYCLKGCGDCPDDADCAEWTNGEDRCLQECDSTRDCRTGYLCIDEFCMPGDSVLAPFDFDVTEDVLGIECGGENLGEEDFGTKWRMTYEVPNDVAGYAIVPFVHTGTLRPTELGLPSGTKVDLISDYKHHNVRATEFQFFDQESDGTYGEIALDWPILVPYSPDRADVLESGTHTIDVITSISEPCHYVLPASGGTVLDLNVIFMGLEGYSAGTAATDADIQEVFNRVDEILGQAGLTVGSVEYFDAPREIAERYSIVRDEIELRRATAFGAPRSESMDGHLNVDMFLVQDIRLEIAGRVLGISAGLPGPPGLHGNPANGLIFTGADIGSDNEFVAHIMAHELGHYIGLRHTTEVVHNSEQGIEFNQLLGTVDPISDTPECASPFFEGSNCPDYTNLMFPAAPAELFTPVITAGQSAVLQVNPLTKPAE